MIPFVPLGVDSFGVVTIVIRLLGDTGSFSASSFLGFNFTTGIIRVLDIVEAPLPVLIV